MANRSSKRRSSLRRNTPTGIGRLKNTVVVAKGYEYAVRLTAAYRKRKPPQRRPMWITSLRPWREQELTRRVGAENIPLMLEPDPLGKYLSLTEKWAKAEGSHLLLATVECYTTGSTEGTRTVQGSEVWRSIATWDCYRGWSVADVVVTDPVTD